MSINPPNKMHKNFPFQIKLLSFSWILFFLISFPLYSQEDPVQASGVRCSPVVPELSCFDVQDPGPIDITMPGNNTRIEKDGLRICGTEIDTGAAPISVVFAVDYSGSMPGAEYDPNFEAPVAVTNAINSIKDRSPNSLVGYFGFGNGICTGKKAPDYVLDTKWGDYLSAGQRGIWGMSEENNTVVDPVILSDPANLATLLGKTDYSKSNFFFKCGENSNEGTHYFEPFDKALNMLNSTNAGIPDSNTYIIFVTDGFQSSGFHKDDVDRDSFDSLLAAIEGGADFPQVYSIFIGGDNDKLERISTATGGKLVSVENANTIGTELANIINTTVEAVPSQTTVTNVTNGFSQITNNLIQNPNKSTEFVVGLEKPIPLNLGLNQLTITSAVASGEKYTTTINLSITDPAETQTGNVTYDGKVFDANCVDATSITLTHPGGSEPITLLGTDQYQAEVKVSNGPADSLAVTLQTDDGGTLVIPGTNGNFNIVDSINTITKTYTYQNPDDPRDKATATITKTTGPILLSVNKTPANFKVYQDFETGEQVALPDTLLITLSQPLWGDNPEDLALWNTLLLFSDSNTCKTDDYSPENPSYKPLPIEGVKQIDNVTYTVLVPGDRNSIGLQVGDCAVLNPAAHVTLTKTPPPVDATGSDSQKELINSHIFNPIIGNQTEHTTGATVFSTKVPRIDDNGNIVDYVDVKTDQTIERKIFLPTGITPDGEIVEADQVNCTDPNGLGNKEVVQSINCLSVVEVLSQEGYVAEVSVTDHLGKLVHHSTQRFGMGCDDLAGHKDRLTPEGYLSHLIWNQKDTEGSFVGSGVYIWKVIYNFSEGEKQTSIYKQGVVRQDYPAGSCVSAM